MCELCPSSSVTAAALDLDAVEAAAAPRRRARLWEIDGQWHCMIVGTCLSFGELKSQAGKLGVQMRSAKPTAYEVHTSMIHLITRERVVGKALHKLLDRKHSVALNRSRGLAGVEALTAWWEEALAKGDVAAPCWAVMTHPDCTDELRNRVFGDVHMLSHQLSAAARTDQRAADRLEREKEELEAKAAKRQERLLAEITRRNDEIRELRRLLELEAAESRRLGHAARAAGDLDRLSRTLDETRKAFELETAARRAAEDELRRLRALNESLELERMRMEGEAAVLRDELDASEARLSERLSPAEERTDGVGECSESCADLDLCGRCILFVGGRGRHLPHFRRVVEEAGGTFSHHDGGFEDNMARLHSLFSRADAVMFPVDGVSHGAHDELKRLCRRWEKPFVPVRRSGLGAFLRALGNVAEGGKEA